MLRILSDYLYAADNLLFILHICICAGACISYKCGYGILQGYNADNKHNTSGRYLDDAYHVGYSDYTGKASVDIQD